MPIPDTFSGTNSGTSHQILGDRHSVLKLSHRHRLRIVIDPPVSCSGANLLLRQVLGVVGKGDPGILRLDPLGVPLLALLGDGPLEFHLLHLAPHSDNPGVAPLVIVEMLVPASFLHRRIDKCLIINTLQRLTHSEWRRDETVRNQAAT